ncbi:MAG: hypothetical protein QMD66_02535 [Actinomycetota bacterium]|nr:hypothetical protein [Actinomycetota bacterium]
MNSLPTAVCATNFRIEAMHRKTYHVLQELGEHLPYSIFSAAMGLLFLGVLSYIGMLLKAEEVLPKASKELFHVFHPVHLLLSAAATTAMFWSHEKRFLKALIIGFLGAVVICGLSDIVLPFLGGSLLGVNMHLHICILEHPGMILPFVLVGIVAGFLAPLAISKSTQYSHAIHVMVSSMASILYLTAFGLMNWMDFIGSVFIIVVLAVMIPCCISDIVFPLLLTEE